MLRKCTPFLKRYLHSHGKKVTAFNLEKDCFSFGSRKPNQSSPKVDSQEGIKYSPNYKEDYDNF
jgi:hypothetical protein